MKTIPEGEFAPGTHIRRVIAHLIANAPARVRINNVILRAKYATTNPEDVYRQYHRNLSARYKPS